MYNRRNRQVKILRLKLRREITGNGIEFETGKGMQV
jgi:hypothetical protein